MEHGQGGSYRLDPDADARVLVERTGEAGEAAKPDTPPSKPRKAASRDIAAATEPVVQQA